MKVNKNKYEGYIEYFLALLLWLSIPPSFLWNIENNQVLIVIFFIIISVSVCKKIYYSNSIFSLFLIGIYTFFSIKNGNTIFGFLSNLMLCFIVIFPPDFLSRVFDKLIKIFSLFLIPSIIVYILVVIFNISLPYDLIDPLVSAKKHTYFQYPFLVVPNILTEGLSHFRFYAYFDEPGVVGTLSGIFLLVNKVDLKKWESYPLLISGLFSMSIAFYLITFLSILLFQPLKYKLLTIFVLTLLGIYLYTDETINKLIFQRLVIIDGKISADNRTTESMDYFMKQFWNSDKVFWGYGNNYSLIVNRGGASYKDLIINFGIFGFLIFCISTISFAYKNLQFSRCFFIYIIIFCSIIYQRPFITSLIYFILIFISIFYIKETQVNEKKSRKRN